ncbi:MAG: hypothetical protein Q4A07_12305 [Coriobacteriales bacterium]|nr:hypothetical protein [Coriobacteriales bacterium]
MWYKAAGDAVHSDSDAASVKATIVRASVAKAKVALKKTSYTCDGKAKRSGVKSVTFGGRALREGTDFAVSYKDNKDPGTAT